MMLLSRRHFAIPWPFFDRADRGDLFVLVSIENEEDTATRVDVPRSDTRIVSTGDQLRRERESERSTSNRSHLLVSSEN